MTRGTVLYSCGGYREVQVRGVNDMGHTFSHLTVETRNKKRVLYPVPALLLRTNTAVDKLPSVSALWCP